MVLHALQNALKSIIYIHPHSLHVNVGYMSVFAVMTMTMITNSI